MQRINIDTIMGKLKNSKYWDYYVDTIIDNINKEDIDYFIGKKGILEINDIGDKFNYINFEDSFWDWTKFDNLKKEFIDLIFDEIKFCPNCGKVPFLSTNNLKSFDLDHFFPKNKKINNKKPFKYLTYNFYNLIPICTFCNQKLKKTRNPLDIINKGFYLYFPYFGWIWNEIHNYSFDKSVTFSEKDKHGREYIYNTNHSDFFKLNEIYNESNDAGNDISFIKGYEDKILTDKHNAKALGIKFDLDSRKEYFFKNYVPQNENEILNFSNGKLKKDLIGNIKI